jgi:DNA-binding MarR family transcriptional regulator
MQTDRRTHVLILARLLRVLEATPDLDLTISQFKVLGQLSTGDERSSRLATKLAVTKPTVTSLIDGLVERGYVTRVASPDDRRAVTVSITPEGRAAAMVAAEALQARLDDVIAYCDDPASVLVAIDRIGAALDARWDAHNEHAEHTAPAVAP